MFLLWTKYPCTNRFNQIDRLASGHERNRFTVHFGNAGLAIVAIERQRERREILVIQMQRQRDFLLPGGFLVREAARRQGAQGVAEMKTSPNE